MGWSHGYENNFAFLFKVECTELLVKGSEIYLSTTWTDGSGIDFIKVKIGIDEIHMEDLYIEIHGAIVNGETTDITSATIDGSIHCTGSFSLMGYGYLNTGNYVIRLKHEGRIEFLGFGINVKFRPGDPSKETSEFGYSVVEMINEGSSDIKFTIGTALSGGLRRVKAELELDSYIRIQDATFIVNGETIDIKIVFYEGNSHLKANFDFIKGTSVRVDWESGRTRQRAKFDLYLGDAYITGREYSVTASTTFHMYYDVKGSYLETDFDHSASFDRIIAVTKGEGEQKTFTLERGNHFYGDIKFDWSGGSGHPSEIDITSETGIHGGFDFLRATCGGQEWFTVSSATMDIQGPFAINVENIAWGETLPNSFDAYFTDFKFYGALSILNVFSVVGEIEFDGLLSVNIGAKTVHIEATSSSINFALEINGLFRSMICKTQGTFSGTVDINGGEPFTLNVDATSTAGFAEISITKHDGSRAYAAGLDIGPGPLQLELLGNGVYFNGKAHIDTIRYIDKDGREISYTNDLVLDGDIKLLKLGDQEVKIESLSGFNFDGSRTKVRILDLEFDLVIYIEGDLTIKFGGEDKVRLSSVNGFRGSCEFKINGKRFLGRDWDWNPGTTTIDWDLIHDENGGFIEINSQHMQEFDTDIYIDNLAVKIRGGGLKFQNFRIDWDRGPLGGVRNLTKTGSLDYSWLTIDAKLSDSKWHQIFPILEGECLPSADGGGPYTTYADQTWVDFDASETFCADKIRWDFDDEDGWDTGGGGEYNSWVDFESNKIISKNLESFYDDWEDSDCNPANGGTPGFDCSWISDTIYFATVEVKKERLLLPDIIDSVNVQVTIRYKYSSEIEIEIFPEPIYEGDLFTVGVTLRNSQDPDNAAVEDGTSVHYEYYENNDWILSETTTTNGGWAYFYAIDLPSGTSSIDSRIVVPDFEAEYNFKVYSKEGYIKGSVKDAVTDEYLSGVQVSAGGFSTTTSDGTGGLSLGTFELCLPEGWYTVAFSKNGYQTYSVSGVRVNEGTNTPMNDVKLNPGLSVTAYGPESGNPGVDYEFHGTATGGTLPYSWTWDFDDGTVEYEQRPEHSFSSLGTYHVKVIVQDAEGDTAQDIITVEMNTNEPPNKPRFTISNDNPNIGDTVTFTVVTSSISDPDGEITEIKFNFGDGDDTGWLSMPKIAFNHVYSSSGTYTVRLSVKDNAGASTASDSDTVTVTEYVNQAPHAIACVNGFGCVSSVSGSKDESFTFTGDNSYDSDGFVTSYKWSCFLAGTKVTMADGTYKNIEDVKIGDMVKSYDETTKTVKNSAVTQVMHHTPEEMLEYYMIINNKLRVTPNHRLYINNEWSAAGNIRIGDTLLDINGEEVFVTSIEKIYKRLPTYNLEIKDYHTYYAEDLLVHNAKIGYWTSVSNGNSIPSYSSSWDNDGDYTVTLYVKDNGGKIGTDSVEIHISGTIND